MGKGNEGHQDCAKKPLGRASVEGTLTGLTNESKRGRGHRERGETSKGVGISPGGGKFLETKKPTPSVRGGIDQGLGKRFRYLGKSKEKLEFKGGGGHWTSPRGKTGET